MGAIVDFIAGPILGSTNDAKEWNDKVTNWGDTQQLYQTGIESIMQGSRRGEEVQREMLNRALTQKPEDYSAIYEPIRQKMQTQLMRGLGVRGLAGSGYAPVKQAEANNDFNFRMLGDANQRMNSNNALLMNAGNQIANSYNTGGNSLASLYSNLGNLRYENSAGKHMLSLWGGN